MSWYGRLLVGFVWLNLQSSVSWLVDFQWDRVAQSLAFCVMVGRFLVGFVWLNLQSSVSWQVDIQWVSCGSIFRFLCHGWQTVSGVRLAQYFVFCVKVANFQWGSCGSIFSFLCHGRQTFRGFVWLNLQFSASWFAYFQWGSCVSIFSFLRHGWETFSGVRLAQTLVFCVMVGRLSVGFVWLNLQFSASWLVDFQGGSRGSIFSLLGQGRRLSMGFVWLNLQFSASWLVDFQGGSRGSIFSFLGQGRRLSMGFVWLNLQFSVSWQVDFQWGSCVSIFSFLCHGWQTFSGLRVSQSLDFCVMVGILLVGFVRLNLLFSVSWLVDFQWDLCVSIFSFLCHGRQTFSGVRVAQSLVFCVMVGGLLVGFVWLNLLFSVSWLVDFQWASCVSIFSFLCHGWQTFSGVRVALQTFNGVRVSQSSFLCHGWQTFSGVRVAISLVFCVMVGRLLVGFVWLNLQISVS